jgi:hypothetical protein
MGLVFDCWCMHLLHTAASWSIVLARKARRARTGDIASEVAIVVELVGIGNQLTPPATHFKRSCGLLECRDGNIMLTKTTSPPNHRVFLVGSGDMRRSSPYHMFSLPPKAARSTVVRHKPILILNPVLWSPARAHAERGSEEEEQHTATHLVTVTDHMCAEDTTTTRIILCAGHTACLFALQRSCESSFCLLALRYQRRMFHES